MPLERSIYEPQRASFDVVAGHIWCREFHILPAVWTRSPAGTPLEKQFLEMVLPGFHWISLGMYILGVSETFVYGAYVNVLFAVINNVLAPRFARPSESKVSKMAA